MLEAGIPGSMIDPSGKTGQVSKCNLLDYPKSPLSTRSAWRDRGQVIKKKALKRPSKGTMTVLLEGLFSLGGMLYGRDVCHRD